MMERNEDPKLWDLLGTARAPRVAGNFADQTLRAVRNQQRDRTPVWTHWLRWGFAPVFAAAVVFLTNVSIERPSAPKLPAMGLAEMAGTAQLLAVNDLEEVDQIADLLNEDDNSLWLNTSLF